MESKFLKRIPMYGTKTLNFMKFMTTIINLSAISILICMRVKIKGAVPGWMMPGLGSSSMISNQPL